MIAPKDWCYPEQPELTESPTADEDRGTGAAGGIDRGVGDRDADEMNQREAEALWRSGAKPFGARSSVAPRMTRRKRMR